jgi:hypothetical protein
MYVSEADRIAVTDIALDELNKILAAYKAKHTTQNRKPTTKPKRAKKFRHVYVQAHELQRKVGIEYTFMAGMFSAEDWEQMQKVDRYGSETIMDNYAAAMYSLFKIKLARAKVKTSKVTRDPACIEAPSIKMGTRRQVRRTSKAMHKIAGELGMCGHTDWHGGGGAHVHVNMGSKSQTVWDNPVTAAVLLDAMNRPYINWAFANPGDTHNTSHTALCWHKAQNESKRRVRSIPVVESELTEYRRMIESQRATYIEWNERYRRDMFGNVGGFRVHNYANKRENVCRSLHHDEGYTLRRYRLTAYKLTKELAALRAAPTEAPAYTAAQYMKWARDNVGKTYGITPRGGYNTLEFRIFQAPNRWQEHERQVDFALAYIHWCECQAKVGKVPQPVTYKDNSEVITAWPLDKCKTEFVKFLRMIGLNPKHYRGCLTNMELRFKLAEQNPALLNASSY